MNHDPNIVLLGGRLSSIADITCEEGDPSVFKAGLAVRFGSDGKLAFGSSSPLIGISMGTSILDYKKTSVMRVGNHVPLLLQDDAASAVIGDLSFTAKVTGNEGDDITVTLIDDLEDGSASVTVFGTDIIISMQDGVTDAQTIKEAIEDDEEASDLVTVSIASGEDETPQDAAAETSLSGGLTMDPIEGTYVKIDRSTGKASESGDTTAAIFLSGRKTGLYPDKTTHPCCLVGLIGGF